MFNGNVSVCGLSQQSAVFFPACDVLHTFLNAKASSSGRKTQLELKLKESISYPKGFSTGLIKPDILGLSSEWC